jgi:2-methylcitrate dehydratase PrpD
MSNNENIANKFINSIYSVINEELSNKIIQKIIRCFIDYMGVTIAGSKIIKNKNENILIMTGIDEGICSVIGQNKKTSLLQAVILNGLSAHIAELDDGVITGIIHPGAPVFSGLLSVAEKENINFEDFCYGVLVGYESAVRIANAIQPSHKKKGYHATSTCGSIGVAMGIATMLKFSRAEMKDAMSTAIVSAHGSLKVLEDDSELKPFNVGSSALNGVIAAFIAKSGFKGPEDAFSGNAGFLIQVSDNVNYSKLYRNKNEQFCIGNAYFKPYAACRYCHPSIEAAFKIRKHPFFNIEDIEKIDIFTYSLAVKNHDHIEVHNISSAKMSIPFSVGVALLSGNAGIEVYSEEYIDNPIVTSLMKKVIVSEDDTLSALFPEKSVAIMNVIMKDGKLLQERVDYSKGDPKIPLSDSELIEKFYSLWNFAEKNIENGKRIIKILQTGQVNLKEIMSLLRE